MERAEKIGLAKEHGTNTATINRLLDSGIKEEDLDDVLSMREQLSNTAEGENYLIREKDVIDTVKIEALVEAYKAVHGDLEQLSGLVEIASDIAENYRFTLGLRTRALNVTVRHFLEGNSAYLDTLREPVTNSDNRKLLPLV